jgi:putative peptide zinc metalloprotease protein
LEAVQQRVAKLRADQEALTLRARHDGVWVAPGLEDSVGRWLPRGNRLGLLLGLDGFEFISTVIQEDGDALFRRAISGAEIRLYGQVGRVIPVTHWAANPNEQRLLPSPALGWMGGGDMAVTGEDDQGRRAMEPFYEVRADFGELGEAEVFHGLTGKIRFDLEPEPLLQRGVRRLRQLLQKRYQI